MIRHSLRYLCRDPLRLETSLAAGAIGVRLSRDPRRPKTAVLAPPRVVKIEYVPLQFNYCSAYPALELIDLPTQITNSSDHDHV